MMSGAPTGTVPVRYRYRYDIGAPRSYGACANFATLLKLPINELLCFPCHLLYRTMKASGRTALSRMQSLRIELQNLHEKQPLRGLGVAGERGEVIHRRNLAIKGMELDFGDTNGSLPPQSPAPPKFDSGTFSSTGPSGISQEGS